MKNYFYYLQTTISSIKSYLDVLSNLADTIIINNNPNNHNPQIKIIIKTPWSKYTNEPKKPHSLTIKSLLSNKSPTNFSLQEKDRVFLIDTKNPRIRIDSFSPLTSSREFECHVPRVTWLWGSLCASLANGARGRFCCKTVPLGQKLSRRLTISWEEMIPVAWFSECK